ncbi:MAG TPA: DNA-binding response regulator [Verrucomicrobiales bacterium]|nr:DNA-binding response regulator [Verrucomicrobiales bacterium]
MTSPGSESKPVILVIDDEPQIRRLLTLTLEASGYRTLTCEKGKEGLLLVAQQRPALVLLDLGLSDLAGIEVLQQLREWSKVPVIILSVQDSEPDKVAALDLGADDYVTKPFHAGELLARIRVALRHAEKKPGEPVFRIGGLVIDLASRLVTRSGKAVPLTATEYALLRLFVQHAGKVLTHRHILREVWGPNAEDQTHYLRVYLARLREKLEADPANPTLFSTEPGVGYRLRAE